MRATLPTPVLLIAMGWGFAEASLFFIVPDVLISFVALRYGLRAALKAGVAAAIAAAGGGLAMYLWASLDPAGAKAAVAALPAIDAAMVESVAATFAANGYGAMLAGAFSGVPYKIYAVAAGDDGRALMPFVLATPFVRLPRFLLAALLTVAIDRLAAPRLTLWLRAGLLACLWVAFYGWYLTVMP